MFRMGTPHSLHPLRKALHQHSREEPFLWGLAPFKRKNSELRSSFEVSLRPVQLHGPEQCWVSKAASLKSLLFPRGWEVM